MSTPPRDRHPPAEELALVALDEQVLDTLDMEHVLDCPACLLTLSLMVRVARAARSGPTRPAAPPTSTWQEIRRRL